MARIYKSHNFFTIMAILLLVTALLTAILAYGYFWLKRNRLKYPTAYENRSLIVLAASIAMEILVVALRN